MACVRCASAFVEFSWHTTQLSLCRQCYSRVLSDLIQTYQAKCHAHCDNLSMHADQGSEVSEMDMSFDVTSAAQTLPSDEFEDSDSAKSEGEVHSALHCRMLLIIYEGTDEDNE